MGRHGCDCGNWCEVTFGRSSGMQDIEEFDCPVCGKEHRIKAYKMINVGEWNYKSREEMEANESS